MQPAPSPHIPEVSVASEGHPLRPILEAAARGNFPEPTGEVTLLPAPQRGAAVVAFTAAHYVMADMPGAAILARLDPTDIAAAMRPPFLAWLAATLDMECGFVDMLMARLGSGGGAEQLHPVDRHQSPRVARAERHREDVTICATADGSGTVIFGTGLAGRLEISIELEEGSRSAGRGTGLLRDAMRMLEPHQSVFAQVSPGNAASVRAFLGAGFKPLGSEVLVSPRF